MKDSKDERTTGYEDRPEDGPAEDGAERDAEGAGVSEPGAREPGGPGAGEPALVEAEQLIPLEQHQRLLAEFDNFRKRTSRERAELELRGAGNLIARLLPLLDDFERAKAAMEKHPEKIDREGLLIMLGRLAEILQREGLTRVLASPGTVFDPEIHEAVLTMPTAEVPEGSVAEVLENGYRYGDRLLRPARVAVARSLEPSSPAEEEDTG